MMRRASGGGISVGRKQILPLLAEGPSSVTEGRLDLLEVRMVLCMAINMNGLVNFMQP